MNLALYLHFPWCVQKCPYCDFNSHALKEELPEARYIDALLADVAVQAPRASGRKVTSLFLGGGTPSLFAPAALDRLFTGLRGNLSIDPDAEVTLEANPATVERGRFAEYRAIGINRVSLGAQSFNDETLKGLGRIHQRTDVLRSAEELHASGLTNFNLDLMYALPHQSVAGALGDVRQALQLAPAHLSHYQLTLEPGTLFAAKPPPLPDDDTAWQMQLECQALLAGEGFAQYEVSAYARPGHACRHNLNYWQFGDYLGAGAGAHGKLTAGASAGAGAGAGEGEGANASTSDAGVPAATIRIARSTHLREPRRYQATAPQGPDWRTIPPQDLPFEFMMNALRLNAGFTPAQFTATTGLEAATLQPTLDQLRADGLLARTGDHWHTTPRGQQFLNEVLQRFLPPGDLP